ncbi:MAG: hypothetical protein OXT70_12915 [Chloroflexota bacterium]|nr:hypothetical protein [Chloroflexota bacterium]
MTLRASIGFAAGIDTGAPEVDGHGPRSRRITFRASPTGESPPGR